MFRIPENRSIQFIKYKTTCKILCHQILSRRPVIIINNFIEDKLSTTELSQSIEIKKEDEEWAKKGEKEEERKRATMGRESQLSIPFPARQRRRFNWT